VTPAATRWRWQNKPYFLMVSGRGLFSTSDIGWVWATATSYLRSV
jgi:hypothetical protein